MASLTVNTNLAQVLTSLGQAFETIFNKDYLLRPVAIEVMPLMTKRIHQDGQAADGSQIGTYSNEYMKLRTGNYGNSKKVSRGKNKGKLKDAGTFTKGAEVGAARPKYNRSSDTKVIVSLTRQLENDWSVMETPKGYGIGFTNAFNADKLRWVGEIKDKDLGQLSVEEIDSAFERVNELLEDAFSK